MKFIPLFIKIIFADTRICLINKSDYSILQLYDGLVERVSSVEYTSSYIYVHCFSNKLYRTKFTELKYIHLYTDITMFSVNHLDNILYLDTRGNIYLDSVLIDIFQFDIKYIRFINTDKCIVHSDKIIWKDVEIPLSKFLFGYKNYIIDSKGIHDLNRETFYKIKNVETLKEHDNHILVLKCKKWYKILHTK